MNALHVLAQRLEDFGESDCRSIRLQPLNGIRRLDDNGVRRPVSLRDLPATIMDVIGAPCESPFPGTSLKHCWGPTASGGAAPDAVLLCETNQMYADGPDWQPNAKGPLRALVSGRYHLVCSLHFAAGVFPL